MWACLLNTMNHALFVMKTPWYMYRAIIFNATIVTGPAERMSVSTSNGSYLVKDVTEQDGLSHLLCIDNAEARSSRILTPYVGGFDMIITRLTNNNPRRRQRD